MTEYFTSKNKIKAVRQLVRVMCVLYFEDITPRELDAMSSIIMAGEVGSNSKILYITDYKTTKEGYNQQLDRLYKKGILVKKDHRTGKKLHPLFDNILKTLKGDFSERSMVITYDVNE